MKESAQAALSYARAGPAELGIPAGFFEERDVHVHVPEGAIPKDGPSAGSRWPRRCCRPSPTGAIRSKVAMTGEITLRGNVLPVGGIKEKVLAARRSGIHTLVLPEANRKNLEEIPRSLRGPRFVFVRHVREVFDAALVEPRSEDRAAGADPRRARPRPAALAPH